MMIVDHYSDKGKLLSIEINWEQPKGLDKSAYAWEEAELFPIHTPEDALLSALYYEKQASELPEEIAEQVGEKIAQALIVHGVEDVFRKVAKKLTEKERKELPDSVFGLVVEDSKTGKKIRKYPMPDAEHVRKAIQFFKQHYERYPEDWRTQIAKKIVQKAKEFGVEVRDETVLRYAGVAKSDMKKTADLIREYRVYPLVENKVAKKAYEKVAEAFEKCAEEEVSPEEIEEAINALSELDQVFGIDYRKLPSPRLIVYNEKLAEEVVEIKGVQIPVSVFEAIPDQVYKDIIGSVPSRNNLKAEIEALPEPEKELIYQFIVNEGLLE